VAISDRPDLEADTVVNAAGTGAPAVAALLGRNLPMRNRWGIVAQVETPAIQLGRVIMHDLIDIRPGPGHVHFLHSDAVDATLPENPVGTNVESKLVGLLHRAQQLHPAFDGAFLRGHTVGLRPIRADGFPVIGSVTTLPKYYEAVSHSGLTLAPVIAEILAAQILGKPGNELDLSLFSPDRFAS
jgi:glycine/D-amino acid oxidase-like deaminating enzyme